MYMKINRILISIFVIACLSFQQGNSQNFLFAMEQSQMDFEPMPQGVHITAMYSEEDWQVFVTEIPFSEPVQFSHADTNYIFHKISVYFDANMQVHGINELTGDSAFLYLAPMADILDYVYLGEQDSSNTQIWYFESDQWVEIRFVNMTFFYPELKTASPDAAIQFAIRIHKSEGSVQYHYGDSDFESSAIDAWVLDNTLNCGLSFNDIRTVSFPLILLEGYPAAYESLSLILDGDGTLPDTYRGMLQLPEPGTLITFFRQESNATIFEKGDDERLITVMPNPGQTYFIIRNEDATPGRIAVTNASGQLVYAGLLEQELTIDTASWPTGIYTLFIVGKAGVRQRKWVKN
jgi:hypothetical protein